MQHVAPGMGVLDMNHVFICHSTEDRSFVDTIRDVLREDGMPTWIAPDNIPVGASYANEITNAIKSAGAVVLILSANSLHSVWVEKEVERAVHYRKKIFPVQIDDAPLTPSIELMISSTQIVNFSDMFYDKTISDRFLMAVKKAVYNIADEPVASSGEPVRRPEPPRTPDRTAGTPPRTTGTPAKAAGTPPRTAGTPAKAAGSAKTGSKPKSRLGAYIVRILVCSFVFAAVSGIVRSCYSESSTPAASSSATGSAFTLSTSKNTFKMLKVGGFILNFPLSYDSAKIYYGIEDYSYSEKMDDVTCYEYETKFGYAMQFYVKGSPTGDQKDFRFIGIRATDSRADICGISPGMSLSEAKDVFNNDFREGELDSETKWIGQEFSSGTTDYYLYAYYGDDNVISIVYCTQAS